MGIIAFTPAAATAQEMLDIEELEISLGQGPCLEAYRTGEQVLVEDLARCHKRWPEFTPRIVALGMRSASAFPLRLRGDRIGALNLYRAEVVIEADIPEKVIADFIRTPPAAKAEANKPAPRRTVKKKRTR